MGCRTEVGWDVKESGNISWSRMRRKNRSQEASEGQGSRQGQGSLG